MPMPDDYLDLHNDAAELLFLSDRKSERARAETVGRLREQVTDSIEIRRFELKKQHLRFEILRRHVLLTSSRQMADVKRTIRLLENEYENSKREFSIK